MYALTSLGERPCTSVARVRGAIDTLVALVTVEAQSYGPKACILMRVIETVSTVAPPPNATQNTTPVTATAPAVTVSSSVPTTPATVTATPAPVSPAPSRPTTPAAITTKSTTHSTYKNNKTIFRKKKKRLNRLMLFYLHLSLEAVETNNSLQQQHAHQQIIQENEQFALSWLRATFEPAQGIRIEQEELYKKYLGCCTKIGRRGVIAPLHFPRCVRYIFKFDSLYIKLFST